MQDTTPSIRLCTLAETAEQLRKTEPQLRWLIHTKQAPKSALIGGRRMFRQADIDAWITAQFEQASA
ncbi:helix-turn-helix transcriptional regulator [Herbiconiux solani]|uniref:helix-turn-helix transcriptional regulator n=1 Tax=Herbiconiux solani TaxID=661329 RepID=UPI000A569399|nr:helix-turn-helix domain-containing protein [Herbiconiux solani]